jgi:hypothetical protein
MRRLPLPTQTLYAELVDQLRALSQSNPIAGSGTFVTKQINGQRYYYYQYSLPGGGVRQEYIGKHSTDLEAIVSRWRTGEPTRAEDQDNLRRLAAQLRAGGMQPTDAASGRVLRALAAAGVFRLGGVVVGTHAFVALGNLLGVRWAAGAVQTQDVDIASSRRNGLDIAVPMLTTDVPKILDGLQMGFLPIPALNAKSPSTSFKVRGKPLRVDLLTPGRGASEKPVFIPRLNAAAQPLNYLDYLLHETDTAAVIESGPVLVNVPAPARFALHKLAVATLRPPTFHARVAKDLHQAAQVLELLTEERPGDISLAWRAAVERGRTWERAVRAGLSRLERSVPEVHARVAPLLR